MIARFLEAAVRLPGGRFPSVGVAVAVTLLSAIRALEPASRAGAGFLFEVAGFLAIGVLIVSASRAAACSAGIARRPARFRVRLLGRAAARTLVDVGCAIALCLPALAAGWEAGATRADVVTVTLGLLAAPLYGTACGMVLGRLPIPTMPAVCLAVGLAAVLLWPASLGWTARVEPSFPGPESTALPLVIGLSALALLAVVRRTTSMPDTARAR